MNVYIAIQEFSAPQIGKRIHVGDTVGKLTSSLWNKASTDGIAATNANVSATNRIAGLEGN